MSLGLPYSPLRCSQSLLAAPGKVWHGAGPLKRGLQGLPRWHQGRRGGLGRQLAVSAAPAQ